MPERADSLVIGIEVDLANARREYEAWKREVEGNPLRVGSGASGGSTGRTFTGMEGAIGTVAGAGATSLAAMATIGAAVGGSGFGPAARPVPTASTNSVYGDTHSGASVYGFGGAQLGSWAKWRRGMFPEMPTARSDLFQPTDAALDEYAQRRYLTARGQAVSSFRAAEQADLMDDALRGRSPGRAAAASESEGALVHVPRGRGWRFGGGPSYNARPSSRYRSGDDDVFEGEVVGEPYDVRNNNTALATIPRPQPSLNAGNSFGSRLRDIWDAASGATRLSVIGAGLVAAARMADDTASGGQRVSDRQRYDALTDAAEATYADQRGVTGLGRFNGGLLNSVTDIFGFRPFVDRQSIDESRDVARIARGNSLTTLSLRAARDLEGSNAMIGSEGFGREAMGVAEGARRSVRDLVQARRENPNVNNYREQAAVTAGAASEFRDIGNRIAQAVQQSLAGVRTAGFNAANDPFQAGLSAIDANAQARRFSLERSVRGLSTGAAGALRSADDATYASERGGFIESYNRGVNIGTLGINAATAASRLSRRGDTYGATVLGIRAETSAALAASPGYSAYQAGAPIGDADRARISGIIQSGQERVAAATQGRAGAALSQQFQISAGRSMLGLNPLQAQLDMIDAGVSSQFFGMDKNVPEVARGLRLADIAKDQARQSFAFQTLDIGIGLSTSRLATSAAMQRNYAGAQAIATTGGAIGEALSIFQSGRPGLARERLANGLQSLDLQAQEFGLGFRAEQFDYANRTLSNPRDSLDPQEVADTFTNQRKKLRAVAGASDENFTGTAAGEAGATALADVAKAAQDILAILRKIAPDGQQQ